MSSGASTGPRESDAPGTPPEPLPPLELGLEAGASPAGALLMGASSLGVALVGLLGLDHLPMSLCLFKFLTGCPCPTCGATRAFGRLFARDFPGAFSMNPLVTAGTFLVALWGLVDLLAWPFGRAVRLRFSPGVRRIAFVFLGVLALVNWAYLIAAGR